jgi:hypothetical protein
VVTKTQDHEGYTDELLTLAGRFLLAQFSKPEGERMIADTIAEMDEIAKKSLRSAK